MLTCSLHDCIFITICSVLILHYFVRKLQHLIATWFSVGFEFAWVFLIRLVAQESLVQ